MVFLSLCMVSMGTGVLLAPLFLWRFWSARRSGQGANLWSEAIQVLVVLVIGVGVILAAGSPREVATPGATAPALAAIWATQFMNLAVLAPMLGDRLTASLFAGDGSAPYMATSFALSATLLLGAYWAQSRGERWLPFLALWGIGTSFWTILSCLVRPNAFRILGFIHDQRLYDMRYSFILFFVGVLWWLAVLGVLSARMKFGAFPVAAFLIAMTVLSAHRFVIPAYGNEGRWRSVVPALESSIRTGCPPLVFVGQYPKGWIFAYQAAISRQSCPL